MDKKILLRFDDICPTMDWEEWGKAEKILEEKGVVALLGVVPDCQDPDLMIDKPREDFWEYIKELQKKGFTIAMHGYRHVFLNGHSEFTGLPYCEQLDSIREGKRILNSHGIETDVFFAPAHNFDDNTLRALSECGFHYVSDGYSSRPYIRCGVKLLPCRYGGVPLLKNKKGYLTAVVHAHEWKREDKVGEWDNFQEMLKNYSSEIVPFPIFCEWKNGVAAIQKLNAWFYRFFNLRIRPILSDIKHTIIK
jgi:predicted deacetylase